jgi:hypothetical protein
MIKKITIFTAISLVSVSCATAPISDKLLNNISSGTDIGIAENPSDQSNLYYLENGIYQRLQTRYKSSNSQLANAQKVVDDWAASWKNTTGGRITSAMTQMLLNVSTSGYLPKDYEKTALASYRALNHIDLNSWENARVEIKKMYQTEVAIQNYNQALYNKAEADRPAYQAEAQKNQIYNQLMNKFNTSGLNSPNVLALKNSYQSAFSHYLAGFVFEALGEVSLARPGYVNALKLNPNDTLSKKSITNLDNNQTVKPGYTNLLIIQEVGHAPKIKTTLIPFVFNYNIGNKKKTCINSINLFFPELVPDMQANNIYNYSIDNKTQKQELYTDFNLMAGRYLHDQLPNTIARNITSAIRNFAASQAACSVEGDWGTALSIAASVAGVYLDSMSESTWVLLPSKIYLNRIQIPYGTHTININVNGHNYTKTITLNAPYQILDMRIVQNKVFFMNQQ